MNSDRDFETTKAEWLNAGSDTTPPHLIDAVLLAARSTPQERDFRIPWSTPIMNKFVTFGFGAAAVVVIAVFVAAQLFGSPSGVGSGGEPTPSPEETATESSSSPSVAWGECTELEAGTYRAAIGPSSVTVSVPSGWKGSGDLDGFSVNSRGSCLMAGGVTLLVSLVSHVYSDACDGQGTSVETGTPAAVSAALAAQAGHQTSGPSDTTVSGYPASRFEFSFVGAEMCNGGPLWRAPGGGEGPGMYSFEDSGSFVTVYVVDVNGSALAIAVDSGVPDEPADVAELDAIVDSLRIEP